MRKQSFAFLSGRFGFLVLALLTVAVVASQVVPTPQPVRQPIAASATIRLYSAAERLQDLEALARSLERHPGSIASVEVTVTEPDRSGQADVHD